MKPEWAKRYQSRFSDFRLPKGEKLRGEWAEEIGADGRYLLEKVYESADFIWLQNIPAIEVLRCLWIQHYHASEHGVVWRKDQELPPSALLIQSPYDIEARYSKKKNIGWVGYKALFTEGCDSDQPHFLLEVMTTASTTSDGEVLEDIHERLAEKQARPSHHLVDTGYVNAENIVKSQQNYQIDLVGPALPDTSWASKSAERFDQNQFSIDWETKSATCPAGQKSRDWGHIPDRHGKPSLRIRFPLSACRSCPLHAQFTPVAAKVLILRPDQQSFQALQDARKRQETPEFRALYAKRAGVEGTIAQAVRTCEIRRSRYLGLNKLNLQAFLTATSINVLRACHWLVEEKHAAKPSSRFAKLVASLECVSAA